MTSYLFEIGSKRRKTARLIGQVRDEIVRAFVQEKTSKLISQDDLAAKLDVNKSVISRDFNSYTNMTLSKVADYAWALDCDIVFKMKKKSDSVSEFVYDMRTNKVESRYEVESEADTLVEA